ncbi:hypothetical protein N9D02_03330 [Emcibacteraceae bacterium]|nr:hypothetical protein [Emcibacteraceae bacterium]
MPKLYCPEGNGFIDPRFFFSYPISHRQHMTGLAELPDDNFKFFAVPVKVKGMGTFPVRAFGIIDK